MDCCSLTFVQYLKEGTQFTSDEKDYFAQGKDAKIQQYVCYVISEKLFLRYF